MNEPRTPEQEIASLIWEEVWRVTDHDISLPDNELEAVARRVLSWMRENGYRKEDERVVPSLVHSLYDIENERAARVAAEERADRLAALIRDQGHVAETCAAAGNTPEVRDMWRQVHAVCESLLAAAGLLPSDQPDRAGVEPREQAAATAPQVPPAPSDPQPETPPTDLREHDADYWRSWLDKHPGTALPETETDHE